MQRPPQLVELTAKRYKAATAIGAGILAIGVLIGFASGGFTDDHRLHVWSWVSVALSAAGALVCISGAALGWWHHG